MRFALIAGLVTTLSVVAAEAQTPRPPRGYFDVALVGAQPTGDFGLSVDEGWGLELGGRYELDPGGLLSVRASMGFINYGNETLRFCSVYSCRVGMDLDTRNNILFMGVGPELAFRMGPVAALWQGLTRCRLFRDDLRAQRKRRLVRSLICQHQQPR